MVNLLQYPVLDRVKILHCFKSGLTCPYLDDLFNVVDEDLAVADVTGVERLFGGFDDLADGDGADNYVDLYLRQQVRLDLNAAVVFGLALLGAAAQHVGDGHTSD